MFPWLTYWRIHRGNWCLYTCDRAQGGGLRVTAWQGSYTVLIIAPKVEGIIPAYFKLKHVANKVGSCTGCWIRFHMLFRKEDIQGCPRLSWLNCSGRGESESWSVSKPASWFEYFLSSKVKQHRGCPRVLRTVDLSPSRLSAHSSFIRRNN